MNKLYILLGLLCLLGCSSVSVTPLPEFDSATDSSTDTVPTTDSNPSTDGGMQDATIITDAAPDLGSLWPDVAGYWDVDAALCVAPDAELAKLYVSNDIHLAKAVDVPYTGDGVVGIDVFGSISDTISNGTLPYDPNGVYFLLPSKEVPLDGYCYYYCGYHESGLVSLGDSGQGLIRYSIVPSTDGCTGAYGCNPWSVSGVSNADGMASIMAHELAEAASDPDPLLGSLGIYVAWRDGWGYEVGDKCAWTFGNTYIGHPDAGSSIYNIEFGNRRWLIQQMWSLASPGGLSDHCVLDMNGNPGFDIDAAGIGITLDGGFQQNEVFPMEYFGGQVLSNPINIYYIYYGAWAESDAVETKRVLKVFANNIGGSHWWQIMTPYWSAPGCFGDGGLAEASTDAAMEASMNDASTSSLLRRSPAAARTERVYGYRP